MRILFSLMSTFSILCTLAPAKAAAVPDYTQLFPQVYARQGPPLKRIALTFDDGPDGTYTPQILTILKREHIHATFFVLGTQILRYPNVLRQIHREGHALGNHSFDHANLVKLSTQGRAWEVTTTDREMRRLMGIHTTWVRAPYGSINAAVLQQLGQMGYHVVNWSVDSNDWRSLSAEQVEKNVLTEVRPGAIILQHCAGNPREILTGSVSALPTIIHTLRARGYTFVTVPELLSPDTRTVHAKHGK